jgi:hypothetical protein
MFYRGLSDIVTPDTAPSGTAAQTARFRLRQENGVRVEQLNLKLRLTTAAGAITGAAWGGFVGVIKEVRVIASDALGKRNVVRMSGIALAFFAQQNFLNLDGNTQVAYASAVSYPLSTALEITLPVPIRHPAFGDPFGNQLSLPLSSRFLGDDVMVEVDLTDLVAGGAVFTTNPPTYHATEPLLLEVNYRKVPESVPYIPSELVSDLSPAFAGTSKQSLEIPNGGYLTQLGIQGLSSDFEDNITRSALVVPGNQVQIDLNRERLWTTNQEFIQARNDRSRVVYPRNVSATIASSFLFARAFNGEMFFDFVTADHGYDVFSVASAVNLDPAVTGSNKLKVTFADLANASFRAHFHYHKLLPMKAEDLNTLAASV